MSHFEMFAIHFPLRFSRDRYFLSFVECLGLFATIPFLTWSHDSWMRNSVRLRPEHWATHTSNESHALRNPFSPKTRVIALHANPQDFMRLYKNPTSASEHPARKNNLRPRELNVPLDKARLFYSYLRQSFSLQSFYLRNVDERNAKQKSAQKLIEVDTVMRHETHAYMTCNPMRRQRRTVQTQMNFPISRSFFQLPPSPSPPLLLTMSATKSTAYIK